MPSHHPSEGRAGWHRLALLGLAALSVFASVAYVLAPVERAEAVYSWPSSPSDPTAVAIPLMLSRPAELTASVGCADVRDSEPGTVLLSSIPLEDLRGEPPLPGLRVAVGDDGGLQVRSGGTELPELDLPSGDCTVELHSTQNATTLLLEGRVVERRTEDLRPAVAGVFTEAERVGGLAVAVTADTVFQTSPSAVKTSLAVLAVLSLLGALLLVARTTRRTAAGNAAARPDGDRDVPAARSRPRGVVHRLVDAGVVGTLAVWTVIGPLTVDDGYISGIIRSRAENGYIGNVYRWFNSPEAPFGWFYEVMGAWSQLSGATVWMRIPSSLLGVATWFLVTRGLLPRLGSSAARPGVSVTAGAVFLLWWLPSNLGLRPEPWVAAGLAAVLVLVERGLARGRLLPLLSGLVVAGATLAVTPTGAVAFLPYLAAAVPILRLCRSSALGLPALAVTAAACAGSALLLMFADQSLAAIGLANEFRAELPGSVPWYTEAGRWHTLLTQNADGSVARRMPVLLTLLAVVGIVWQRSSRRLPEDVSGPVAGRLVTTFGLFLLLLLFTPTKWTMHFGVFVPAGTALIVLSVHLFGRRSTAGAARLQPTAQNRAPATTLGTHAAAVAAVLLVAALSWSGTNTWAYVSDLDIPWNDIPPQLLGIELWSIFLTGAVIAGLGGAALVVWARSRGDDTVRLPGSRWLPSAGAVTVGIVLLTVALPLTSFAKASWERRDTYTLASDALATVNGRPCGLAEDLVVEQDPLAGLLEPSTATDPEDPEPRLDGFTEMMDGDTPQGPDLEMAGAGLPGWAATGHTSEDGTGPAALTTGWFELPGSFHEDGLPLVVTTTGHRRAGTSVIAEFGTVSDDEVTAIDARGIPDPDDASTARDARLDASAVPADADVVRLVVTDGGAETDQPVAVSVPRVPVTEPFLDVVPPSPALVDWPVAFLFPCQELSVQANGITDVPRWRIAPALPNDAGDIVIAEFVGGPYSGARTLVDQVQIPVYQDGRPLDRPVMLYEWAPRVAVTEPDVEVEERTVGAWAG
jgi:arabinosyltransferase A/arabinosyltransferase B/arabinosyltransferase C